MMTNIALLRNVLCLGVWMIFGIADASATGAVECVLKPNAGQLKVTDYRTRAQIGTLNPGDRVYTASPQGADVYIITGKKFTRLRESVLTKFGNVKFENKIDCRSPANADYPIVIDLSKGHPSADFIRVYQAFGFAFPDDLKPSDLKRLNLEKPSHKCSSLFDDLSFSKTAFETYKAEGFSLVQLCNVLRVGSIIFHPETGQRLPTYVERQDNEITDESLFMAPRCFARGQTKVHGVEAWMWPIGCTINYHPWSGRRLNSEEIEFFTREMRILGGGYKGGELRDVQNLVGGANRRTLGRIENIPRIR
jgi:hypothetical protein